MPPAPPQAFGRPPTPTPPIEPRLAQFIEPGLEIPGRLPSEGPPRFTMPPPGIPPRIPPSAPPGDLTPPILGDRIAPNPPALGERIAPIPPIFGDRIAPMPPMLGDRIAPIPPMLGDRIAPMFGDRMAPILGDRMAPMLGARIAPIPPPRMPPMLGARMPPIPPRMPPMPPPPRIPPPPPRMPPRWAQTSVLDRKTRTAARPAVSAKLGCRRLMIRPLPPARPIEPCRCLILRRSRRACAEDVHVLPVDAWRNPYRTCQPGDRFFSRSASVSIQTKSQKRRFGRNISIGERWDIALHMPTEHPMKSINKVDDRTQSQPPVQERKPNTLNTLLANAPPIRRANGPKFVRLRQGVGSPGTIARSPAELEAAGVRKSTRRRRAKSQPATKNGRGKPISAPGYGAQPELYRLFTTDGSDSQDSQTNPMGGGVRRFEPCA